MTGLRIFTAGYFASMATGALVLGDTRSAVFGALFAALLIGVGFYSGKRAP